ncbi:MAG: DUF1553 domain-containing protein [Sedimentisphaerales bacterium]|nr:DUF1553 domain-containing protein [Sedimentisphaerales bacterium]
MEKARIPKIISTVVLLLLVVCAAVFGRARRRPEQRRRAAAEPQMQFGQLETNNVYTGINNNLIDSLVMQTLRRQGIQPANLCSDEVFIRRVYLDVNGSLPEPRDVQSFLENRSPHKRAALINKLLKREEFADYWALKWCDLLRVKAEFPINLWPNAVQAYHRWIHDCLRDNMPYDKFVREMLTSSGSNFRVPQVNFYRAIQRKEPSAIAGAVSLTFMGVRPGQWQEDVRAGMEAFFSRVAYKGTAEWKEEIVYLDPTAAEALKAVFPDGVSVKIKPGEDPRVVFADWLIDGGNPWFARNIVNRIWSWLFGRGIIHEPDDIRPDNPPVNPELLAYLEKELVDSDYDLRYIYSLILNSQTYQQSSIPRSSHPDAEAMFACYPVRRLEAEVLVDALGWISGTQESYSSPIPEPFTFIPEENRTIELADGSISSQFLEMFGRPSRDTGMESERDNQPSDAQRLHLLNSSHVQTKIERSKRLNGLIKASKGKREVLIGMIYLNILSRYPMQKELAAAEKYFETKGIGTRLGANDLAWALINSKEFLYRH